MSNVMSNVMSNAMYVCGSGKVASSEVPSVSLDHKPKEPTLQFAERYRTFLDLPESGVSKDTLWTTSFTASH